jgi:small nuclear ribonucleoprotein (snRNP)-like protein
MPPRKAKTLAFFLRGLYGQNVIVQLLNETRIEGKLFNVDDSMK